MKANIYSGETKLNEKPVSIETASRLLLHLSRQGVANLWLESLQTTKSDKIDRTHCSPKPPSS